MNRRTLFKSLFSAGALAALPGRSSAESAEVFDPRSVQRFKRWRIGEFASRDDYGLSWVALEFIAAQHLSIYGRVPDTIAVATDRAYISALAFRTFVKSNCGLEFEIVIDERLDYNDAWYVTEKNRPYLRPVGSGGL